MKSLSSLDLGLLTHQWATQYELTSSYSPEMTSTNEMAKHSIERDLTQIYLTESQSDGRGQGTNTWVNPNAGSALLSSWCFQLEVTPQPELTMHFGLAVFRALRACWPGLPWRIKSPNDIYIQDKKIAGLLLETVTQGLNNILIVGLGINVKGKPESLASAGSLQEFFPDPIFDHDWHLFLDRLYHEFLLVINTLEEGQVQVTPSTKEALVEAQKGTYV